MPEHPGGEERIEAESGHPVPDGIGPEVFRTLVQVSPTPMFLAAADDPGMKLTFVNAAFCRMTGYAAVEVIGRDWRFLQMPDADPRAMEQTQAAVAAGQAVTVELHNQRKDGSGFWSQVALTPVRDPHGDLAYVLGSHSQVGRRPDAEPALRSSRRMELLASLASVVAHEFNNLLTVVLANMEPMERGADERTLRRLNRATDAVRRAARLTHQMLSFVRRPVAEEREVDLRTTLGGIDALLGQVGGSRLGVQLHLPDSPVPVRIDVGEFEAALLDLVRQARAAGTSGGSLRITLSAVADSWAKLTVSCGEGWTTAACWTGMQALAERCHGTLLAPGPVRDSTTGSTTITLQLRAVGTLRA